MNQFSLSQGLSRELESFSHISEFSLTKNNTVQFNSFPAEVSDTLRIYYIIDGKFEWMINQRSQVLYPGDIALVLPGQVIGGTKGFLDIGTFFRLCIRIDKMQPNNISLGKWSSLSEAEQLTLGRIFLFNNLPVVKVKDANDLFQEMRSELFNQEIGYLARVNHLIDSLLIIAARQCTRQT